MPANLENSAVATGLEKVSFHSNPKECSNYHTIALISNASKIMLKILQAWLQQYVNCEIPDIQAGFRKGRGTRDQIANICWLIEKQESSRKISTFTLLTMLKPLTVDSVDHKKREKKKKETWKFLKEMEIPDHLSCLLQNLYSGQEAS